MKTKDMTRCAFMCILYIIGSKIIIPAGIIPLTLQTMMVILAGILLTPRQVLLSYGLFLGMGLLGFPVFASGGGIAYVLQPSFGFLLGFPIAACFISFCQNTWQLHQFSRLFPLCLLALCIIYSVGCFYMYLIVNLYMGVNQQLTTIISIGALPFIISDTCSIAIACGIALRLQHIPALYPSMNQR